MPDPNIGFDLEICSLTIVHKVLELIIKYQAEAVELENSISYVGNCPAVYKKGEFVIIIEKASGVQIIKICFTPDVVSGDLIVNIST